MYRDPSDKRREIRRFVPIGVYHSCRTNLITTLFTPTGKLIPRETPYWPRVLGGSGTLALLSSLDYHNQGHSIGSFLAIVTSVPLSLTLSREILRIA